MKIALSKWIPKRQVTGSVQIDSGSFGKIYRSTYKDAQVAVKEIAQASSLKSKMKDISYELDALVLCDHPNVVHFHGAAIEVSAYGQQPSISLVFELCDKGSLHRNIFERKRTLNVRRKVLIGAQVAAGLAYLHQCHVLHRDLNTRNVLLSGDFTAKIADFGCAVSPPVPPRPAPPVPPPLFPLHPPTLSAAVAADSAAIVARSAAS